MLNNPVFREFLPAVRCHVINRRNSDGNGTDDNAGRGAEAACAVQVFAALPPVR